ncbi:MAG: dUTP pyrophosphatase [Clostridia bacterium]|nr:dUTP pyrophosphatase [Clostridia bacterium]
MVTIYFSKINDKATIPRKRNEDAGYDIFACLSDMYICVPPHHTVSIPTGIASAFPSDYFFQLAERGSTGVLGIAQRSGVIDSGYRGEWFIPITNTNNRDLFIAKREVVESLKGIHGENAIIYDADKAICQALLLPVPKTQIIEVSICELKLFGSERGEGKCGSTNS